MSGLNCGKVERGLQVIDSAPNKVVDIASANSLICPSMIKGLTRDDLIAMMKRKQGKRTAKQYAEELGVSAGYLCEIYLGRRNPGDRILSQFGLTERVIYEKVS